MNASESPLAVGRKPTRGLDLRAWATIYGNSARSSSAMTPPTAIICLAGSTPLLSRLTDRALSCRPPVTLPWLDRRPPARVAYRCGRPAAGAPPRAPGRRPVSSNALLGGKTGVVTCLLHKKGGYLPGALPSSCVDD